MSALQRASGVTPPLYTPAFQAYAVACLALAGLFYFLAFRTGGVHTRRSTREAGPHEPLENCVPFFVVGFLFAVTEPGLLVASVLYGLFVSSRVLHAAVYLSGRQPVRSV